MCGVKGKKRLPSKQLRERLGIDDITLVLQQNRMRRYGHVLRKEDDDWVKNVRSTKQRVANQDEGKKDLERGCGKRQSARKLNKDDGMDRSRKLTKDV